MAQAERRLRRPSAALGAWCSSAAWAALVWGPMAASAVVGFIDMDCFYVAVERQRSPGLLGVPCAVVQYNSRQRGGAPDLPASASRWVRGSSSGGIIAVSYEARSRGVTRQMNCQEARRRCPEIVLVQVPTAFGKADLQIYKDAGDRVVNLLSRRAGACEKRSVDEVAIDITAEAERLLRDSDWFTDLLPAARRSSHLADSAQSRSATAFSRDETRRGHAGQQVRGADFGDTSADARSPSAHEGGGWATASTWYTAERRLIAGAVVVAELRAAIASELGFTCSGGIAENKILAKLGCGLHKPNQQTVVLPGAVAALLRDLPLDRLPGLGGDLGAQVREALQVSTASELAAVPWARLETRFPRQATVLLELAEGRRSEPVQDRELCRSLSNCKTFGGSLALNTTHECEKWLHELAGELHQRYVRDVARNSRAPTRISVSVDTSSAGPAAAAAGGHSSRQKPFHLGPAGSAEQIAGAARDCFRRWSASCGRTDGALGVVSLGLSLSSMQPVAASRPVTSFFGAAVPAALAPVLRAESCSSGAPGAPPVDEEAAEDTDLGAARHAPGSRAEHHGSKAAGAHPVDVEAGAYHGLHAPVSAPGLHAEHRSSNEATDAYLVDVEAAEHHDPRATEDRGVQLVDSSNSEAEECCAPRSRRSTDPSRAVAPAVPAPSAGFEPPFEVDPWVWAELPPDVQAEVRGQLGLALHGVAGAQPLAKRRKGVGGSIDAFFKPAARRAAGA
uniref:DNA polymerase eta n=1 Tax=Alexandrium monilatum TaxID=311494 RepID=A0A7S4VP24_9DINO